MTNQFRKPSFKAAALATLVAASALVLQTGCSSLGGNNGPDANRDRGSVDSNTALIKIDFNGVERPVVIDLYPDAAPKTVANFKKRVLSGDYEGLAFHRVIPRFLVQTGDPLTRDEASRDEWGTGGNDETVPAEIKLKHQRGVVAAARLGNSVNPSKASSAWQFYILLARGAPKLDGQYTVFGQVVQGLEVLDQMSKVVVDTNDSPLKRIEVTQTSLIPAGFEVDDPGTNQGVGGRKNTVPASKKGPFTKFIERVW